MVNKLLIEYVNPIDCLDVYTLSFKLRDHSVAKKWGQIVSIAIKKYQVENTFIGFLPYQEESKLLIDKVNSTIDTINSFEIIIDRRLTDIADQDTLNYLHHVFEIYHGFLQQQTHEYWKTAPINVQTALANLNNLVHHCEMVGRRIIKQQTVNWFQMPKVAKLTDDEYSLFDDCSKKGTVYLNYTEIGKRLEELAFDNDSYIDDDAFRPFKHFTADFTIKFYDDDIKTVERNRSIIKQYYEKNKDFFNSRGYTWGHSYLNLGNIPLADIENASDTLIDDISKRQQIRSIQLI